jgi:hypothetical protein
MTLEIRPTVAFVNFALPNADKDGNKGAEVGAICNDIYHFRHDVFDLFPLSLDYGRFALHDGV